MPKKGGGKKGGKSGGAAKKKPAIPQREPPDEPLMERKPMTILTVNVRGVVWRMMDFTQRVPSTTKVHEIRSMIADRHGGGVTEFTLYKEENHPRNLLADPSAQLGDLEFANANADRIIFYDFQPRVDGTHCRSLENIMRGAVCFLHVLTLLSSLSVHVLTDCPLLLRPPLDMRIKAMFDAEEAAKREKAERFGSRGKKESSVSVFD